MEAEKRPVVLYRPKSKGEVIGEYPSLTKLASLEGKASSSNIIGAIQRRGYYFSKIHNMTVAPRYKNP